VVTCGQAALLSRAPIRHRDRVRKRVNAAICQDGVDDRDAGANPLRVDTGCSTQTVVRVFNGLPDDLGCPAITDQPGG
jgi:hypothetical protein